MKYKTFYEKNERKKWYEEEVTNLMQQYLQHAGLWDPRNEIYKRKKKGIRKNVQCIKLR
jgi:hypothetical protein